MDDSRMMCTSAARFSPLLGAPCFDMRYASGVRCLACGVAQPNEATEMTNTVQVNCLSSLSCSSLYSCGVFFMVPNAGHVGHAPCNAAFAV